MVVSATFLPGLDNSHQHKIYQLNSIRFMSPKETNNRESSKNHRNSSTFHGLSLIFNVFWLVNVVMATKLSWSDWSRTETIHLGRTQHAGNVSMLLDNFPKGFCEGLNWLMGADLSVFPLGNHPFWKGCRWWPRDLKIRTKSSWQAHERTYLEHIGLGGAPIYFIEPKRLGDVYMSIYGYTLV